MAGGLRNLDQLRKNEMLAEETASSDEVMTNRSKEMLPLMKEFSLTYSE